MSPAAILALAVLLLLPGGLMLLAPWSLRPLLSLAFWVASWWWLPRLGPGRTPFLHGAILAFALLGLTRFLKPLELRRPSLPTSLVGLAMALTFLGPSLASRLLPAEAAFDALTARLLVARDGIPETYEPLLPVHAFALRPPGFASLAADVGLLAGASPRETLPVTAGAAQALLILAAFRLLRRFLADVPAALLAIGFGLVASVLGALPAGAVLGLALALVAAPHLGAGPKAPAVAAGVFLGASVLCAGIPATGLVFAIGATTALRLPSPTRRLALQRVGLASATACLLAAPAVLRAGGRTFSRPSLGAAFGVRPVERWPDADGRAAMAWLESHTAPLDVICAGDTPAAAWIPALAGRSVLLEGRMGPVPASLEAPPPARPCTLLYGSGRGETGVPVLFRSGAVTILDAPKPRP